MSTRGVPKKGVYMSLGHGSDIVKGEPLPVPEGCVYVTFALCGQISTHSHRIMKAFEDPAVRDLLRDPVKHVGLLTEHFGETLHIHYPEAEDPASRTYYDAKYKPFLANEVKGHGCFSKKSGLYRLGSVSSFKAPASMISPQVHPDIRSYTASFPCDDIEEPVLKFIYKGSLHPTLKDILEEYDAGPLTFKKMKAIAREQAYLQSWAFENWPGVHYNFVCRGSASKEENITNSATLRRRRNSVSASRKLLR